MPKPDPYWPAKEAYRIPRDEPVMITICANCGARHVGPVYGCKEENPQPKEKA